MAKIGRPRAFKSPEEFIELAEKYFEDNKGGKISWTGLCLAVGVNSRQALDRYKKGEHGEGFVGPIKKALMIIENYYEENEDGAKGIFVMKNFGWHDKQEIDMTATHRLEDMTEDELDIEIERLKKNE